MVTGNPPVLRKHWPLWIDFLHRYRLESMAVWLLEVIGPLSLLGSQVFSLGSPFLRPWLTQENELAVALLLEDREEALAFASFLREEKKS